MPERDFAGWSRAILAVPWRADGPLSTAELASELGVDTSTLTPLLLRMAERSLLDHEPIAGRGRRWHPVTRDPQHPPSGTPAGSRP